MFSGREPGGGAGRVSEWERHGYNRVLQGEGLLLVLVVLIGVLLAWELFTDPALQVAE
jgi:hypothetical protein